MTEGDGRCTPHSGEMIPPVSFTCGDSFITSGGTSFDMPLLHAFAIMRTKREAAQPCAYTPPRSQHDPVYAQG